jgi:hypothetical protein
MFTLPPSDEDIETEYVSSGVEKESLEESDSSLLQLVVRNKKKESNKLNLKLKCSMRIFKTL